MYAETATFKSPDAFKVAIPVRNNYMYARMKKSLPELYAFTICMWLKSKGPAGVGTPFSYSVPGQSNELVLLEWGTNPMELIINDKVKKAISINTGTLNFPVTGISPILFAKQKNHLHQLINKDHQS